MEKEKHIENHLLLPLSPLTLRINLGHTPLHFLLAGLGSFLLNLLLSLNLIFQRPYSTRTPVHGSSVSNLEPVKPDSMTDHISKGYVLQCIKPFMDCCPKEFVRETGKFDQSHVHSFTLSNTWNSNRKTNWGSVSMNRQRKFLLQLKYCSHHKISVAVINP